MVVDPATGSPLGSKVQRPPRHRDDVERYGNTMVALLAKTIEETGWFASPFERHFQGDYGRLLFEYFWADDHFRDALGDETVSGEANIWPFYTGVIGETDVIASALGYLDANGFCDPYPLRYETSRRPEREVWLTRHVLPDYQGSTVWTSLGAVPQVLGTVDGHRRRPTARRQWIRRAFGRSEEARRQNFRGGKRQEIRCSGGIFAIPRARRRRPASRAGRAARGPSSPDLPGAGRGTIAASGTREGGHSGLRRGTRRADPRGAG
jgi:hypothetical protein